MNPLATIRRLAWTLRQFGASRARPEAVRRAQERRLRALLRHAVARSPFYRDKYRGIDVTRCPLADLPPVTKAELMADFDRVVTDPAVTRAGLERFVDDPANVGALFLGKYPVFHTSGSQGQPMLVVQDRLVLDLLFAFQMTRGNVGYLNSGPLEAAQRLFRPARLAVIIGRPGFFPSAHAWRHLPDSMRPFIQTLYVTGADPDLAAKLRDFRPTTLSATPTTLDLLAASPNRPALPDLRQVVTWSETLTDAARQRIGAAFRAPMLDTYGCGECIFLTTGCPTHPGAHVNADWAVLEPVDARGNPVAPGATGEKAYLTNLANSVLPLIRYELGDRVTPAEGPCGCGSRLPRLARVGGRAGEVFWVRGPAGDRVLTAYPFQHALEHFRSVREWQATQTARNRVVVRVELLPGGVFDEPSARARLAERLAMAGFGPEVAVTFAMVPRLTADAATGKFRRMVSEVGPPVAGPAATAPAPADEAPASRPA